MAVVLPVPGGSVRRQRNSIPYALVTAAILTAGLYFGRDVFVPLAIAILVSFVLAPLAARLQALRLGRVLSVLLVVLVAFAAFIGLFSYVGTQVTQLAAELPTYQTNIEQKIRSLRGSASPGGTLQRAGTVLKKLDDELNKTSTTPAGQPQTSTALTASDAKPIPVEVHLPPPTMLESLGNIAGPFLHPLAMIGIVLVFVIFILFQREDLRDRLIRLAGSHDLQRSTAAIDDAAKSLSRYFLAQISVNACFGVLVGIGLSIIGVPNPILWGTLGAILRFVPYIGSMAAGVLPVLIAAAVDPGWSMAFWAGGTILVLELLAGQIVEPTVYGHSSGLSPLALVISATLWTALWGPIGLLLSTPLTICLVVIGRHIDQLEFLDVVLGNRPPLTPPQNFYQRLLAHDPEEAAAQAETILKERTLDSYYDEVAMKGLELAQNDLSRGALDGAKVIEMKTSIEALVDDLSEHVDASVEAPSSHDLDDPTLESNDASPLPLGRAVPLPIPAASTKVLCIGGRSGLDDAAAVMLAQLLQRNAFDVRTAEFGTLTLAGIAALDPTGIALICVSYLDVSSLAHLRFAVRRLRRRVPTAKVLVGCWGQSTSTAESMEKGAKADFSATSLRGAVQICLDAAQGADHTSAAALKEVA